MMTKINYQPWLQAVLTIAKHYRIEPSEERVRLQVTWDDDTVPIKEIVKLLIEEYNNVLNVLSGKGDVGQPKA